MSDPVRKRPKIVFLDFNETIDFIPRKTPIEKAVEKVKENLKPSKYFSKPYQTVYRAHDHDMYYKNRVREYGFGAGEQGDLYGDESYWGDYYPSPVVGFKTYKYVEPKPNQKSLKFLKKLLDETGAKIVYSTTRRYSGWKNCAEYLGLSLKYSIGNSSPDAGVTPDIPYGQQRVGKGYFKPREQEIETWLSWYDTQIDNYVILDDDPIEKADMSKHWIPSIAKNGFLKNEYKLAKEILLNPALSMPLSKGKEDGPEGA